MDASPRARPKRRRTLTLDLTALIVGFRKQSVSTGRLVTYNQHGNLSRSWEKGIGKTNTIYTGSEYRIKAYKDELPFPSFAFHASAV